jgi:hypothetical protein
MASSSSGNVHVVIGTESAAARMEGWSFRRIARFAESVVRAYVSGLDVGQLEGSEPPCRGAGTMNGS